MKARNANALHCGAAACGTAAAYLLAGLAWSALGRWLLPAGAAAWGWAWRLAGVLVQGAAALLCARGWGMERGGLRLGKPGPGVGLPVLVFCMVAVTFTWFVPTAPAALPAGGAARALAFLALGPAPALCEELVFRGAVQGQLRAAAGPRAAVVMQAALFAALHSGPAGMAYALCMGLVLGWAAERTGSVWPAAGMHLANNLVVFYQTICA